LCLLTWQTTAISAYRTALVFTYFGIAGPRQKGGASSSAIDAVLRFGNAGKYVFARPPAPGFIATRPNSTRRFMAAETSMVRAPMDCAIRSIESDPAKPSAFNGRRQAE